MRVKVIEAAASILAAAMIAMPAAAVADMSEIDCGSSSFSFADDAYHVDCERSAEQIRAGQSSGASRMDVMTISRDEPRVFMTVVDIRITATRIYMQHRNLRQNFREAFDDIEAEDWKGIGNKGGYDSAEFTAVISGLPSSCVAIQRYTNPA